MKARPLLAALSVFLVAALGLPAVAAAEGKRAGKAGKTTVVGKDAEGDWGASTAPEAAPLGAQLGQDLLAASLQAKGKNLNFTIKVTNLPPSGGWPEVTRYTWNFQVDGKPLELDGKFSNFSRGTCDPTAGSCPPPRDPGLHPFVVRGNCAEEDLVVTTFTFCEEFAAVEAVFDASKGTITIPVPLKAIKAKRGSKIQPGANIFGGSVSAAPSAWATSSGFPMDVLSATKTFTIK